MTSYAIYWEPAGHTSPAGYDTVINAFFSNVAAASGTTSNVFGITPQYADSSGRAAAYADSFGGERHDVNAYPASGCKAPKGDVCLTDTQVQAELATITAGQPHGLGVVYFVFLPPNVQECFGSSPVDCTFKTKGGETSCGHHSHASDTYYAVLPYPTATACKTGKKNQLPNGNIADETVRYAAHEAIEAVTDPTGESWYAPNLRPPEEIGDECEWDFGVPAGKKGHQYNQTINGAHYFLQGVWSNRQHGCALQPPAGGVAPPSATFTATNVGGRSVQFDASGSSTAAAKIDLYEWSLGDGANPIAFGPLLSHSYPHSGSYDVQLIVEDSDNLIAAAAGTSVTVAGTSGSLLLYEGNESVGNDGTNSSYTELEGATGREVQVATSMPPDLSGQACVLLQINQEAFSAEQTNTLQQYMSAGGVVVAIGEWYGYVTTADDNLTALASSLGLSMAFEHTAFGGGYHTTAEFGSSPFATGLHTLEFAAATGVSTTPPAEVIASEGEAFMASQAVGKGAFVMLGDSNVLSDESSNGFTEADNGVLARNLCG